MIEQVKRLVRLPIGAPLFAGYLPVLLWQRLTDVVSLHDALRASFLFAVLILVILLPLVRLFGRLYEISLALSLLMAAVLVSVGVYHPLVILASLLVLTAMIERRIAFEKMVVFANIVGVALFASFFWTDVRATNNQSPAPITGARLAAVDLTIRSSIIHVVLDGYGASDVLRDYFDHDNAPFRTALQDMGFQVMETVTTPFNQTAFVMSSVMSGGYVDLPSEGVDVNAFRRRLGTRATNGTVHQSFRQSGYNFAYTPSGYAGFDLDDARQISPPSYWAPTPLEASLLNLSGHAPLTVYNKLVKSAFEPENFETLKAPFYYYQHVLAPHPPFSLTETGELRKTSDQTIADGSDVVHNEPSRRADYIAGYRQKVRFVEQALIDQLSTRPEAGPVVIIVHGDHGPGAHLDQSSLAKTCAKERMNSFLAIYSNVPEVRDAFAAQNEAAFNLVNIYRVLFAALSGTEADLLPDISTFVPFLDPTSGQKVTRQALNQPCQIH